jgi:hypothetical protein
MGAGREMDEAERADYGVDDEALHRHLRPSDALRLRELVHAAQDAPWPAARPSSRRS